MLKRLDHPLSKYKTFMVDTAPKSYKGAVYALGGGSVIDKAKLVALPKPCHAIPVNACGAAMTSHAVVWTKTKKIDVETPRPLLTPYDFFPIKLSEKDLERTIYDCTCHIFESLNSTKATTESESLCRNAYHKLCRYAINKNIHTLIEAGNLAGRAIEITGTNFLHAISYVYTLKHGLCHGDALKAAVNVYSDPKGEDIIWLAKSHRKFFNSTYVEDKELGKEWHDGIIRLLRNDGGLSAHRPHQFPQEV